MSTKTERHEFDAAKNLLTDVIKRQAGSLSKAIAEGVMNSADAILSVGIKDGRCDITVTPERVVIEDNGRGFRSKKEILSWFKTFGMKHDADEAKTFGTFRMGRGQLLAAGRNLWRSGRFSMAVDINKDGLEWDLTSGLEDRKGCRIDIDLYRSMNNFEMRQLTSDLAKWFKYAPIPVSVNGAMVVVDPKTETWDFETDDAYVRLDRSVSYLSVYNLGVYVRDEYGYNTGAGGVLLSKKQLALNFARNEVMRTECRVWEAATKKIRQLVDKLVLEGKKLTKDQIQLVLTRAVSGDLVAGIDKIRLISDCNGRRYTFSELAQAISAHAGRVSFGPPGDSAADRLLQTRACLVLDKALLGQLNTTAGFFFQSLQTAAGLHSKYFSDPTVVDFTKAKSGLEGPCSVLDEKAQSFVVRAWLSVCRRSMAELTWGNRGGGTSYQEAAARASRRRRRLLVGDSPTFDGWTDGDTYIALNRVFLERQPFTVQGLTAVGCLLAHEMAHDEKTDDTHHHGVEFYEEFEDICQHGLPQFVSHGFRTMHRVVAEVGKTEAKRLKVDDDAVRRALESLDALAANFKTLLEPPPSSDSDDAGTQAQEEP